ncbi:hypothetical protein [Bacillus pseudomycoides]|uniref:hypothetical protein n=1 Tax=Bacillus pseudomycoides TaxID=64104 RepID=UPI00211D6C39|nr:hypothetical protein [Bacillus pseudomycoides]
MTWLSFFSGYFTGTLVTLFVIYFGYRAGEMNKAEKNWNEIDKSVEKEMEQSNAIMDDKGVTKQTTQRTKNRGGKYYDFWTSDSSAR